MPDASLNVRQALNKIIKKFKFEELESTVFPVFPEFSWTKIKAKLVENHESLTVPHVLQLIEEEINHLQIRNKTLRDRLEILEVIAVSRHSKSKLWYCYECKGERSQKFLTLQEVKEQVKQSCVIYHMEVDIQTVLHNGLAFLLIKERPKKKQIKTIAPTYFSFSLNDNYFFTSKKAVLKTMLMAVTNGMGYKSCKEIKLHGKDIHSLIQLLLNRKNSVFQGDTIKAPLKFKPEPPSTTPLGFDFTQHKQRRKYAEQCLGSDPPTFEFLRVKTINQKWKHKFASEKLPDKEVFTGVEFRSSNITNFLKNLVTEGVLTTPLPCYATNILRLGRNDLTVKEI